MPAERLVGPAVVIDKSAESAEDPDFCLTVDHIREFEAEHGPLPESGWLLLRTGWDARAHDEAAFLNADDTGPHTPGFDVECARWIAEESPLVGVGVETVGTDAGAAHSFDPPFPVHSFVLGAGKYGLTQLANLAQLPPTGAPSSSWRRSSSCAAPAARRACWRWSRAPELLRCANDTIRKARDRGSRPVRRDRSNRPRGRAAPSGSTAPAQVFFPNPVQSLRDESLTDQKDANYSGARRRPTRARR